MLNLDPSKLLVIAMVAVILLGPDRLPAFARQVGGIWRSISEYRHRMEAEVRGSMPDLPSSAEIARLARSPAALLDHLATMSTDTDGKAKTPEATAPEDADHNPTQTVGDGTTRPTATVRVPHIAGVSGADPGLN
jgi:Sec-independent protein translocase protein TatA